MDILSDKNYLLKEQYKNDSNLQTRMDIHAKFSTNKKNFHRWAFENYQFTSHSNVLEVGCGTGELWAKNKDRIPVIKKAYFTDFSSGMLERAKAEIFPIFREKAVFKVCDVQDLPFQDELFDVVIANHMLYHVPSVERAINEIYRVLLPNGFLYANTNGPNHMIEIRALMDEFLQESLPSSQFTLSFNLDNGIEFLNNFSFKKVLRFGDSLHVTSSEDLVSYIQSMAYYKNSLTSAESKEKLGFFINSKIKQEGYIDISKDAGIIIARK